MTADFLLTDSFIRASLDDLANRHKAIERAVCRVGYPVSRRWSHSFGSLARIVIGQQLSTTAAEAIWGRLCDVLAEMSPEALLDATPDRLHTAGLSKRKIEYLTGLAQAVLADELCLDKLPQMPDDVVLEKITAVRGFGHWSADMYLIFALGRPDIWPAGDLAVRLGFGEIMGWNSRPEERQVAAAGRTFTPYRSALALLCWRLYGEAVL